jgi:hypothetical protein
MVRKVPRVLSIAVFFAMLAIIGCSSVPEEPILRQFFTASRLRDRTTLQSFAVAEFSPNEHGSVTGFDIVAVSEERRMPMNLRALRQEHDAIVAEDAEFTKRKVAYQNENLEAIQRVLKAEAGQSKVAGRDAQVQAAWSKWRDDTAQLSKKLSEAKRKLSGESSLIQMSVDDPANPVDVTQFDAELVTKDITIEAPVRMPDGSSVDKTLVVTMQRAVLKGDRQIDGRWIITAVKEGSAAGSSPRS